MDSKLLDQFIMNKETLSAIVQYWISCYHIFAIPMFHLHWNNANTDQHRSCFPCLASTLQIIAETGKVDFQIFFSIHCLILICLGFLVWCIPMQRSWMIPLTAGTGQSINQSSTCPCIATFSYWFSASIARFLLCQKLDSFFQGLVHKTITVFQLVTFTAVNAYIWILFISSCKCWNLPFLIVWLLLYILIYFLFWEHWVSYD